MAGGGTGGVGQQNSNFGGGFGMGNASAQPYNPTGGAPQQSTNQSTMSQGLNTMFGGGSPFGMQQPSYGMQNPFAGSNPYINSMPGYGMSDFQQQQQMQNPNGPSQPSYGMQNPYMQQPQPMPQQPQRPAYMDNPDFQAYQTQERDLNRQMNEYMQKAPMYQQLQDLNSKMRGFQQPQGQMGQNPYGNIDQMQRQRDMQDQVRQQQMWQQATQEDAARGMTMDMPPPDVAQGTVGIGNFEQDQLDRAFGRPPRMGGYGPRGGYGGRMGGYGQPQPGMGLQALSALMQGRRGGFGGQRAIPQMMDEFY